jgi:hypothetical protein
MTDMRGGGLELSLAEKYFGPFVTFLLAGTNFRAGARGFLRPLSLRNRT